MMPNGKRMTDRDLALIIRDNDAPMIDRADAVQVFMKRHSLKPFEMDAKFDLGLCFIKDLIAIAKFPKSVKEALKGDDASLLIMVDYRKAFPKASEEEMMAEIIRRKRWNDEAERWKCRRLANYDCLDDAFKTIEKAIVVVSIIAARQWKLDAEVKAAMMPALHSALKFLQTKSEMHSDEADLFVNDDYVNHMCRKWFGASIHYQADLTDKSTYARKMRSENVSSVIHAVKLIFERLGSWRLDVCWRHSSHTIDDIAALAEVFADRAMEAIAVIF